MTKPVIIGEDNKHRPDWHRATADTGPVTRMDLSGGSRKVKVLRSFAYLKWRTDELHWIESQVQEEMLKEAKIMASRANCTFDIEQDVSYAKDEHGNMHIYVMMTPLLTRVSLFDQLKQQALPSLNDLIRRVARRPGGPKNQGNAQHKSY